MFKPKYTISNRLLANIKHISKLIYESNSRRFPHVVLMELEKDARAVSSFASTSIEGNPLPLTEVKKILKSAPAYIRQSEQEVLNYNQALEYLNSKIKKGTSLFSLEFILSLQKKVMETLLPDFQLGKLRVQPVVVNDPRTGKVVYLPPEAKDTPLLMDELILFVKEKKGLIDPLILAGLFHKQMVIVHPFMDGNGRTTRLLTKALLAAMGLNTFNLFSFENYYNKNVTKYFQTVGEYGNYYELKDQIDFTFWLEYFTEGIIDELLRVEKLLPKISLSPKTELKPYHQKILSFISEKGYLTQNDYSKLVKRAKATRNLDLNKLIKLGLIERKGKGKTTYYVLKK